MVVLGITGLIGSGKSEICKILKKDYKIPVIHSDKAAKYLYKFNIDIKTRVIDTFGEKIINVNHIQKMWISRLSLILFTLCTCINSLLKGIDNIYPIKSLYKESSDLLKNNQR